MFLTRFGIQKADNYAAMWITPESKSPWYRDATAHSARGQSPLGNPSARARKGQSAPSAWFPVHASMQPSGISLVAQAQLTRVIRQALKERPAVLIRSPARESSMMNRAVPSPFPSILRHSVSIQ